MTAPGTTIPCDPIHRAAAQALHQLKRGAPHVEAIRILEEAGVVDPADRYTPSDEREDD